MVSVCLEDLPRVTREQRGEEGATWPREVRRGAYEGIQFVMHPRRRLLRPRRYNLEHLNPLPLVLVTAAARGDARGGGGGGGGGAEEVCVETLAEGEGIGEAAFGVAAAAL